MTKLALLAAVLTLGCTPPAARSVGLEPRPAPGWRALAEQDRERALGREIDVRIGDRIGFYGERRVSAYVTRVGRALARFSKRSELSYTFRVLDSSSVNAFAAPGGFVYVTRGMLAQLGTEAELAAILAHEIGHIERRHGLREQAWADERAPSWSRADELRFYERSRDNERDADAWSVATLGRAGYRPRALARALRRLEAVEHAERTPVDADDDGAGWLSSHPATLARIARVELTAEPGRERAPDSHAAMVHGLVYGENPRRGFLQGRSYVLPESALAFELPRGFTASTASSSLFAVSPERGAVLLVFVIRREPGVEAEADFDDPRWTTVAGWRAVFGEVDGEASELSGGAGFILLERELVMLVSFERSGSPRLPFSQLLSRFRRVGDRRLLERRARRIVVEQLEAPSSLADLAIRSGLPRSELALLNGVAPDARFAKGRVVRLVR